MTSGADTTRVQAETPDDKDDDVIASVRLKAGEEKDIRRAAVEVNQSRSEFMAEASVARAREVLEAHRTRRASDVRASA